MLGIPDTVRAYGDAKPSDLHLLADVRAVDEGIVAYLARREKTPGRGQW